MFSSRESPNSPEQGSSKQTPTQSPGDVQDIDTPQPDTHLTDHELFERLGWFISIRWVAGIAALLLVLIGRYGFDVCIPFVPVLLTICVLFFYNSVFLMLVKDAYRQKGVSRRFNIVCANAQIICDLVTLAVLMHFTGGVENYFLIFFICPIIVASHLLSLRNAYAHAALGAALIHAVAWSEYAGIMPHVVVGKMIGTESYCNPLAVVKFTTALSCLLFATVFLGSSIASRLRQREEELEDAYHRLRALEETKSFFMRKTSHELRSPLNAVVTMLQTIETELADQDNPQLRDFIGRAVNRTFSLSKMIGELHRYAILREPQAVFQKTRVNLTDVVKQSVHLYTPMASERQLQITSNVESVFINGDPDTIPELVGNLVVNAIQYTLAGGQIHIRLSRAGSTARLEVSDTGIGIPPDSIDRIFDEFYRTNNAKQTFRQGTGMGLPIVKRIVQVHGGTIAVHSAVGKGTTFIVTLPALVS